MTVPRACSCPKRRCEPRLRGGQDGAVAAGAKWHRGIMRVGDRIGVVRRTGRAGQSAQAEAQRGRASPGAEAARQRAALNIARVKAGEEPVPLPLPAKCAGGPTVVDLADVKSPP